jgi:small ligand-binding sensory domain FIST
VARFGDGVGVGPDLLSAAESAAKQATAPLDGRADLACVFVSGEDPDAVEGAARRAMRAIDARTVLGCTATGVIGGERGIEEASAVSAWAGVLPNARIEPFRLETLRTDDRLVVIGMPEGQDDDVVGVLFADPYSFPVDAFVERSGDVLPGLPLVGGLAGGMTGRESVRLFIDDDVIDSGAVGVVIGGPIVAATLVSQGARPIGPPMVVTKAEDNIVYELAGAPALAKLEQIVAELPDNEQALAAGGLLIGVAMDEYADEHEQGDFLVRGVVGADTDENALAIGDVVEVGRTVRFQVRDAGAAGDDLAELLDRFDLPSVEGALLFSCNGRGRAMFPDSDHDIKVLRRTFGPGGVGGFFAAGEIGPVGGRNHVHGFTASILAFGPDGSASSPRE